MHDDVISVHIFSRCVPNFSRFLLKNVSLLKKADLTTVSPTDFVTFWHRVQKTIEQDDVTYTVRECFVHQLSELNQEHVKRLKLLGLKFQ